MLSRELKIRHTTRVVACFCFIFYPGNKCERMNSEARQFWIYSSHRDVMGVKDREWETLPVLGQMM